MMPRILRSLLVLLVLFTLCKSAFCEEQAPSFEELGMIELRGRQIVEYDRAALAAAGLLPADLDPKKLENYIAVKQPGLWTVYFGRISDDGAKFNAAYIYSCPADSFGQMKLEGADREISGEILELAKAIRLAAESIAKEKSFPRYNTDVFREQDGTITVYLIPVNDKPGVAILGGDYKFSVSKDGSSIIQKAKLHKEALEIPLAGSSAAFNKHLSESSLPAETDVVFVLSYPMLAPQYIVGPKWMSSIDEGGKIYIMGESSKLLKNKRN